MTGESSHRTALITGASRGLGLALARRLAQENWTLIIDARGEDALETARAELANHTRVVAIPGDVTDPKHRGALAGAAH
jgi:NAD(P)-dependent dehydrogenase (short-subunit alcohol dehydrogenase family)